MKSIRFTGKDALSCLMMKREFTWDHLVQEKKPEWKAKNIITTVMDAGSVQKNPLKKQPCGITEHFILQKKVC